MTKDYAAESRSQRSVGLRIVLPVVFREARLREGSAIAELGCGPGTLLSITARRLPSPPLGLDRDPLAVSLARRAGLPARRADFRRIPDILKGRFGVVYSNEALHWTPDPPSRFKRASWHHRFLPADLAGPFRRWGEARFQEGLRGVAQLLEPGGAAVLQFGGRGQLQALFAAFAWVLQDGRFERYRGRLWYPTYYPEADSLLESLRRAGLRPVRVRSWSERLSERTAAETVAFVRAFADRTFLAPMGPRDRALFYRSLAGRLRATGLGAIRWRRTLVVARRA